MEKYDYCELPEAFNRLAKKAHEQRKQQMKGFACKLSEFPFVVTIPPASSGLVEVSLVISAYGTTEDGRGVYLMTVKDCAEAVGTTEEDFYQFVEELHKH